MDDMIERLRSKTPNMTAGHSYMEEAADRIEALEAQVRAADALFDKVSGKYVDYTLVEALAAYRAAREADT